MKNTCDQCKFWNSESRNKKDDIPERGICETLTSNSDIMKNNADVMVYDYTGDDIDDDFCELPDFETGMNFGCVHFEQKG